MGVKDLWSILTPYAERKPICELRGKTVAIDLAGWVCESLNVVDYFVHPRHHLKNLFFRTCYLIWEEITPIFVLEGSAPKLKSQVMAKRNEVQFRGVRPREKPSESQSQPNNTQAVKGDKGRSRFNQVLKQCENLLLSMGIQCIKGPGEAEAYCAFLNHKGLVDGVISQDSDCFAYGAICVYRNFSVSSQGALAAQGGAVDIYDMRKISCKMDFGQNKVIVMALLCGCDYCPDGVGGVGRDSVVKLFNKYNNDDILKRIRSWRLEDDKYTAMEMKVDDKSICTNCGHLGRTQSHTKKGCGICRTHNGCDESLWKEERLSLKAELTLRKKAMADPKFPSEEIIEEFQCMPKEIPTLELTWRQPNMVKFIKQVGHLLQWTEIYCFQKFFPILTRWLVLNAPKLRQMSGAVAYVTPKEIVKKRILKGSPCLEVLWHDEKAFFNGLIPDRQMQDLEQNNPKGQQELWSTVEPMNAMELSYPELFEAFIKAKEKPKKQLKKQRNIKTKLNANPPPCGALENSNDLVKAANQVTKTLKPRKPTKAKCAPTGMQRIDKFLKHKMEDKLHNTPNAKNEILHKEQCSTPLTKEVPLDLESDDECSVFDMSDIVNAIVKKSHVADCLTSYQGKRLVYETMSQDISLLINQFNSTTLEDVFISNLKGQEENVTVASPELNYSIAALNTSKCLDDLDILTEKRILSNSFRKSTYKEAKRMSLDDSFDVLVKMGSGKLSKYKEFTDSNENMSEIPGKPLSVVDRFKQKQQISLNSTTNHLVTDYGEDANGVSYFFNNSFQQDHQDTFEKLMETSMAKYDNPNQSDESDEKEIVELSD